MVRNKVSYIQFSPPHDLGIEAVGVIIKTGRKIRDAELSKVPFIIVIGEKEVKENLISVRRHGGEDLGQLSLEDFTLMIKDEIDKSLV